MTKEDFNEDRQKHFKQAMANVALLSIEHVILDKIEPITRRVSSIRVYVGIAMRRASLVKSMPKMMTDERVNAELSKVDFPNVLMLEVEKRGTGKYFAEAVGSTSCSVVEPKLIFLMVWSAVGVCFCGCVLSFRDDRYIGNRAAVATVYM